MQTPGFVVSSIQRRVRKASNPFFDVIDQTPMWCVTLRSDWIKDRFMQLWYENEAEASRVPKGVITIAQLFTLFKPQGAPYVVKSIDKGTANFGANQWTDLKTATDAWIVALEGMAAAQGRYANLWFPVQAEANQWAIGRAYKAPDLLRAFHVLIVWYPAGEFVPTLSLEGFFDKNGYHKPGKYPGGEYPAGFSTGHFINLGTPTAGILGGQAYLLSATPTYFVIEMQGTGEVQTINF